MSPEGVNNRALYRLALMLTRFNTPAGMLSGVSEQLT
jgi:hypothetical protein